MKVRKGQGRLKIEGLEKVISIKANVWGDIYEEWSVARVQPQEVQMKLGNSGTMGKPVKYVQSGETICLFPTPDKVYSVAIVYHTAPRRA